MVWLKVVGMVIFALIYLVWPYDIAFDSGNELGWLDDAAVILWTFVTVQDLLEDSMPPPAATAFG